MGTVSKDSNTKPEVLMTWSVCVSVSVAAQPYIGSLRKDLWGNRVSSVLPKEPCSQGPDMQGRRVSASVCVKTA